MPIYKRTTTSGIVLEQEVFHIAPQTRNFKNAQPKVPLRTREEKDKFNLKQSVRRCIRLLNNNFTPDDYYITLTLDDEHLVEYFEDARKILDNYIRRLRGINPYLKLMAFMGRGIKTDRIHYHLVVSGISRNDISEKWLHGRIKKIEHLREHNYYNRLDNGADFTGLAIYLFDHWSEEQGKGKRWRQTKNLTPAKQEKPTLTKRIYSDKRPPITPKGYILVETISTDYGYLRFKYIKIKQKHVIIRRN